MACRLWRSTVTSSVRNCGLYSTKSARDAGHALEQQFEVGGGVAIDVRPEDDPVRGADIPDRIGPCGGAAEEEALDTGDSRVGVERAQINPVDPRGEVLDEVPGRTDATVGERREDEAVRHTVARPATDPCPRRRRCAIVLNGGEGLNTSNTKINHQKKRKLFSSSDARTLCGVISTSC